MSWVILLDARVKVEREGAPFLQLRGSLMLQNFARSLCIKNTKKENFFEKKRGEKFLQLNIIKISLQARTRFVV